MMDIDDLGSNFTFVDMVRIVPESNARRWYRVSWEQTLIGWAVVRMYGQMGHRKRALQPLPFDSLDEAWPKIRETIQKRVARGYEIEMLEMEMPAATPPHVTISFGPASAEALAALGQYEQLPIDEDPPYSG